MAVVGFRGERDDFQRVERLGRVLERLFVRYAIEAGVDGLDAAGT
ncbi:hypothetical protein [Halalkalicoccus salilacus]